MLEHGGRLKQAAVRYGIAEDNWLDLSSGIAPWPWPVPEIPMRAWARLPEINDGLEAAACAYYGAEQVLPVPGSQAAIQALPRLRRAGKVGVLSPCYAEHAEAWRSSGFLVREMLEDEVDYFLDSLHVLVVVNPNNPTGLTIAPERLLDWHARLAQRGGWLVVDEAFMDNTPELSLSAETWRVGLIVLRSFGKFFGLAGARLGFVIAEPQLLKLLERHIGPWAINGPTRVLGQACLNDVEGHRQQRLRTQQASERLAALMTQHGLEPQGGCALFQWLVTPLAVSVHEFCASHGVLLRLFLNSQTPQHSSLRFGLPADEAQWQRLEQVLSDYNKDGQ
ncbi:threonine-phosphate decarboxylase CobD [Pseudomonas sp. CCI3.2]|uniref:threonine-phosphate decarboxylase CobD n=1 Tax=unclassified Pseudomonas TaxID=196821 RepID=UPI002AC973FA|nr:MULTISPECIES: threonine-phosphate decarboxylase CobD [unclassified Pseudomonas]MEB0075885.1 threonine-phosphate decarboxylase CobD [Pseudomonas sp. MH10out]MEB0104362.1 threonine-phosphate decarboxylase CobD [Pseudomonas sp. CCI3.2]MEB0130864.1 threonine-phosphate decarboxylase CobD [Pseudomonas sp. CCI2.4]MEB0156532.1 threonine-phosphate decarboxylase CobD [Pseudomonas sp. AH2 (2023)]MEB0166454.1 threonine-phosphate decarboxylase CobD [Pseudomonas sp. CCC4.4]